MAPDLRLRVIAVHGTELDPDVDTIVKQGGDSVGFYSAPSGLNELYLWDYRDIKEVRVEEAGKLSAPRQWSVDAADVMMLPTAYVAAVAFLGRSKRYRTVLHLQGRDVEVFLATREHRPDALRRLLSPVFAAVARNRDAGQSTSATPHVPSPTDDLERLADLYERGVLTAAEFQAAKARVLDRTP